MYNQAVFISRHDLSDLQTDLLTKAGFIADTVDDFDAFADDKSFKELVKSLHEKDVLLVIVVHPLLALRLSKYFLVGVFNNKNRSPIGEQPDFFTDKLVIIDQRPTVGAWELTHNNSMVTIEL